MAASNFSRKFSKWWILIFTLLDSCVDRIEFDIPPAQNQLVVEGMISDDPGPYTVRISRALDLEADSVVISPVKQAKVKLLDDEGRSENFSETSPGVYVTGGLIRGKVGNRYHIWLETQEGEQFESQPDAIRSVGPVENIRFEFEARSITENYGPVRADVFNVYMDANAGAGTDGEKFVRWKFTGTYEVLSYPERHFIWALGFTLPDPYPCSGYDFDEAGNLVSMGPCTCCSCWAHHYESQPSLSDGQQVVNNQYYNIKVGEVPITSATFYNKYQVEVAQMSLSRTAFEFFKLVRAQKEGAGSLFQPPSGEIKGNISPLNNSKPIVGLFYATSINRKSVYIQRSDVPYNIPPIAEIRYPCTWYENSTNVKPSNWE